MKINKPTSSEIIKILNLKPHPNEGGFYIETYRSSGIIKPSSLPNTINTNRNYSTAIYFLLTNKTKSLLHKIKQDELWHFYLGEPLNLIQISPSGVVEELTLGTDLLNDQRVQHLVPAGYWFGAYISKGSDYSLLGCTVSPGFDFDDFELAKKEELLKSFPHASILINKLT